MGGCIGMSKNKYEIRPPLQNANLNNNKSTNTVRKNNNDNNELQSYWSNTKFEKNIVTIDDPNTLRVMKILGI